jgi:protein involved in polysaccharide export with SLBB domain
MVRFVVLALALLALRPDLALSQTPGFASSDTMTLQPGDMVRVQIWREQDLSGEFIVDERGLITLPMLGEKRVQGVQAGDLRASLIQAYSVQLRNPSITITPHRRVNVLGEVQRPGIYPVDPTISLAGVLALAGGTTPAGDMRRIRILRDGHVVRERIDATETLGSINVRSGDQIEVGRRNWVTSNPTSVFTLILSSASLLLALFLR